MDFNFNNVLVWKKTFILNENKIRFQYVYIMFIYLFPVVTIRGMTMNVTK
jgi:hypothetical protein